MYYDFVEPQLYNSKEMPGFGKFNNFRAFLAILISILVAIVPSDFSKKISKVQFLMQSRYIKGLITGRQSLTRPIRPTMRPHDYKMIV